MDQHELMNGPPTQALPRRRQDDQTPKVVFYPPRRGVLVTDEWFCAERHRLAVGDIGEVGWRQSGGHVTRRVARYIMASETILVVVVAIFATASDGLSMLGYALAAAYLAAAGLVTWLSAYRYPGVLQLWASRRGGQQLLLFSSSDQTEFHKVRRALERAVEYRQEQAA
jgi:hypothetical protein